MAYKCTLLKGISIVVKKKLMKIYEKINIDKYASAKVEFFAQV